MDIFNKIDEFDCNLYSYNNMLNIYFNICEEKELKYLINLILPKIIYKIIF